MYNLCKYDKGDSYRGPFILCNMMGILRNRGYASRISSTVKMVMDIGMHRMNVRSICIEF